MMHAVACDQVTCRTQDNGKFQAALKIKRPASRLAAMLALCGGKRTCDETGALQPAYKQEGTRIVAEFPKPKGDDALDQEDMADPIERKQVGRNGSIH